MTSFNMTVEDSSPLIAYAPPGAWVDTPINDPLSSSYSGASYHTTSAQGATATISFNGTGLSIFGAFRSTYGTYSVVLDGHTITTGSAQGSNVTQQLLGGASGLQYGLHTAVLTNTNGAPIDIDWIDFEAQLGGPVTDSASSYEIDNTNSSIVYSPESAWQTNTNVLFFNQTLSYTQVPGASASLTFSGGAIAVYGTVSPDHADIVITVDGYSQTLVGGANGFATTVHPKTLLYYQSGLSLEGTHVLALSGNSQGAGPFIDLDMINVFSGVPTSNGSIALNSTQPLSPITQLPIVSGTAVPESTAAAMSTSSPSENGSSSSHHSTGEVVGAVFGSLIGILLILGIIAFLFLRRRRNTSSKIEKSMISVSPILPMQRGPRTPILPFQTMPDDLEAGGMRQYDNTAFPFPIPPKKTYSLRHSIAPSYYSDPIDSREGSVVSTQSSIPLVTSLDGVPRLNVPQPRSVTSRKPAPRTAGLNYYSTPARPNTRPPTFDFAQMESSR